MHLSAWDIALLLVVSLQAALTAYVRHPRRKALLVTFPVPFSLAYLAVGRPVDATNVLGLVLLLLFAHVVRWLHIHAGRHIVFAIASSALLYGLLGGAIARVIPDGRHTFWIACAAVLAGGVLFLHFQPHREEPGHRSPLPVYIKLPAIMAVIAILILSKHWLRGFITVFPMVTTVAAYEARHSLWTLSRQIPVVMLSACPLMIAMHLAEARFGRGTALAIGWLVFAAALPAAEWLKRRARPAAPCADTACITKPKGMNL